ncbi:MAG TPA: PDZ domain-containing protein, partial [Firmicutes bacterium]|nr:PDZ domain-containing protein [Bacillota bacterium]
NTARKVARYIIENHDKRKSWLGVYLIPVTESIAYVMEFKNEGGLLIAEVVVDSPAYNAGLRSGDVIVSFDGKKVHKTEEFDRVVFSHRAGDEVELTIRRAGKKMTGKIRLGSPPEGEAGR